MKPTIEKIFSTIESTLPDFPNELSSDVKDNISASIKSALQNLDLATREEFEIQEKILQRTRERVLRLESELSELEAKLEELSGENSR